MSTFNPDVMSILTDIHNAYARGRGPLKGLKIKVGKAIWDEFQDKLQTLIRHIPEGMEHLINPEPQLKFKSATMTLDPYARNPYAISISEEREDDPNNVNS